MPLYLFAFFAALAVIGAFGVILQRNPVHCLLALAMVLVAIGILFMGLGAETVGFLQIIIYVGAIMVLFLFVIWLLNLQSEPSEGRLGFKLLGAVGAAILAAELFVSIFHAAPISTVVTVPAGYGTIGLLARVLFSHYLVAFEVTSVLLLATMAGAIALARRVPASEQAQAAPLDDTAPSHDVRSAAG